MSKETDDSEPTKVISLTLDQGETIEVPAEKLHLLARKQREVLERTKALAAAGQVDSEDYQKPITI